MSDVLENGLSFGRLIYRDVFSQKLSVPECLSARSIYLMTVPVRFHLFG